MSIDICKLQKIQPRFSYDAFIDLCKELNDFTMNHHEWAYTMAFISQAEQEMPDIPIEASFKETLYKSKDKDRAIVAKFFQKNIPLENFVTARNTNVESKPCCGGGKVL